ncbi:MAG: hypothetical protein AAFQ61_10920, partial [Cyanobacteria bacterium J06626_23]
MVIASGVLEILTTALFGLRSQYALSQLASQDGYGSIAYEYEKNSYPLAESSHSKSAIASG